MSLIDRFICRREGHIPRLTIIESQGVRLTSVITTCRRCGRAYELKVPPKPKAGA